MQSLATVLHDVRSGRRPPWPCHPDPSTLPFPSQTERLSEVAASGSNPGRLRMWTFVPRGLRGSPPLVVVLHGCGQTAHDIAHGSGWTTLANETGFALLLPEQRRSNNLQRGFNWFRPGDTKRGRGEVLSIRQMVKQMIEDHGLDRKSVFVTGLSAGGAMTAALLSAYPDVFAGGAVIAGVPFGVASNLWGALAAMKGDKYDSSDDLGDKVRASSRHRGCWPKISVWHGDTDTTVAPSNADAIVRQWCNVHGIDEGTPAKSSISGQLRRFWRNSTGIPVIEEIIIPDMGHAVPINALGKRGHAYGTAAPFFEDAGISAAYYIAKFWGLTGRKR